MKSWLYFYLLLPALIIGCKDSNIVQPGNQETGRISLNIDKVNAPSDVVYVQASLTRSNFLTQTQQMNIFRRI
jgi:hypothetical protein